MIIPVMLLKSFLNDAMKYYRSLLARTAIQARHPSCRIHPGVFVDKASRLGRYNTIFQDTCIIGSAIGDHTFIQKNSRILYADIGKFCSIAAGVRIGLGSHPVDRVSSHPSFYSISQPIVKTFAEKDTYLPFNKTVIGHDVWIGENAMIRDGITIGTGAVIAAGAMVTKDVEPYAIVGGIPAKLLRYRFDVAMRKKLLDSAWWNSSEETLIKYCDVFDDPAKFIETVEKNG